MERVLPQTRVQVSLFLPRYSSHLVSSQPNPGASLRHYSPTCQQTLIFLNKQFSNRTSTRAIGKYPIQGKLCVVKDNATIEELWTNDYRIRSPIPADRYDKNPTMSTGGSSKQRNREKCRKTEPERRETNFFLPLSLIINFLRRLLATS